MENPALNPIICCNCGKKIGKIKMKDGIVAIKCPKCGVENIQETKPTPSVQNASSTK